MKNITMSIDSDLLKRARKMAIDKDSSLTGIIRDFLHREVDRHETPQKKARKELFALMKKSRLKLGIKNWTRESLHER